MHPRPRKLARAIMAWFDSNARDLPWRRTRDPYAIWVSEIMLQQTRIATVIPYFNRWMKRFPTIDKLANAPVDDVLKLWEGLGYYSRARNLHRAAQQLTSHAGGEMPSTVTGLLDLPGIGRYTAGAIASIAFNQPTPLLDGNVARALARLFAISENVRSKSTADGLWEIAGQLVATSAALDPAAGPSRMNQGLMELGALICTPRDPRCGECPVHKQCRARRAGVVGVLPNTGPRPKSTARRFAAFVVYERDRVLVRRRPRGVVNAGLWEFPSAELTNGDTPGTTALELFGSEPRKLDRICEIRHTITRYRIRLDVFRAGFRRRLRIDGEARWCTHDDLDALAFTAAHRRIATKLKHQPPSPPPR